jgi:geranylgeranyl reductase
MDEACMYDVVIVGAGPAGSTLARMLDKKYKVLIIDKRPFDISDMDEKCCGGLLAPDAQKMLAELGLGVPKSVLSGPQMFSVKTLDFDNDLVRYYQRFYINVNRNLFDKWLFDLIPDHVDKKINCCYKGYTIQEGTYKVTLKVREYDKNSSRMAMSDDNLVVRTKILIGADGGNSAIRHQAFIGRPQPDTYLSIQKWYKTPRTMPFYTSIFDSSITDFYSWLIQKDQQLLIGTAIQKGKNPNTQYNRLIDRLVKEGYEIGEPVKQMGTVILRTRKTKQIQLTKDGIGLIGEAAGLISPSSAEGISYAIKSAVYMADAINQKSVTFQKKYTKACIGIKRNIWFKNIKTMVIYNRFFRKLVMLSKILALKGNHHHSEK